MYGVLYNTTEDEDLREAITEVNDPLVDGCEDQGDGSPGACPLSKTVDERSEKDGPAPEAVAVGRAFDATNYSMTLSALRDMLSPRVKSMHKCALKMMVHCFCPP